MSESEAVESAQENVENSVTEIVAVNTKGDVGIESIAPNIDLEEIKMRALEALQQVTEWTQSPEFYAQIGIIIAAIVIAYLVSKVVGRYLNAPSQPAQPAEADSTGRLRGSLFKLKGMLFPLFLLLILGAGAEVVNSLVNQSWLVRIAQSLAVVGFIYSVITQFIESESVKKFVKWVAIPIAIMYVFDWLDDVTSYLDSIKLQLGNISISLYAVARVVIFGSALFWLGRVSNNTGKQFIRKQEKIEVGIREVFAKLFEIALYVIIFILLLQVMGINLTALAVFGGAVGVGLGFGLQAIASNFISGLIILLDGSLTVGDYVELEDGRAGTIRELNMRSTVLKTFEGKDIMVPNESFITTSFTNWTHENKKQRYAIEFQVAYSTDVEKLVDVLKETVAEHPQVISGPEYSAIEQPDAEISGFGDSGINILVEYWMEGIDDGINRVDADLNMMIWKTLKAHDMEMPFPQREVRILNPSS